MTPKDYKPQIDGLRALAVLPVIFFHAGFQYFQGGFVGVDVFFVISGYLITKIILKDVNQKKFSLINFYKRRARRILPALYFIILFSIPFAIFIMNREQLHFYSEQIISVLILLSNFFSGITQDTLIIIQIYSLYYTPGACRWKNNFILFFL